jgi:quercetin dioxygenase-like cupin family protein
MGAEVGTFDRLDRLHPYQIWDGAVARAVRGERITFAVVDLEPNHDVPEHRHANEQVGMVLKGSITMVVAGESRTLGVGDTYVIPGNVPHSAASGPDGATVVDVFTPIREDWEQVRRLPPGAGAWPS